MSVDYFLYSPSHNKEASIGSVGLSGALPWPGTPEMVEFVRWAIEENVTDIVMVAEDRLFAMQERHAERLGLG